MTSVFLFLQNYVFCEELTLVMLDKLRCTAYLIFIQSDYLIQGADIKDTYLMANSADPD